MISPLHDDLVFHGPLSEARAARLIDALGPLDDAHLADLGCGWGEFLLRAVASSSNATGVGVDIDAAAIERARAAADLRGLADRVRFEVGDAGAVAVEGADVVVVSGSTHVFGGDPAEHTARTLAAARTMLRPGGRLLLGECVWDREPTEAQWAAMPIPRDQYGSVADLVDTAERHGFALWALTQASRDEWDDFESRHARGWLRRLLEQPDDVDARQRATRHRTMWLRATRDTLGFAYLALRAL